MAGVGLVVCSEWTRALDRSWRAFRLEYHGIVIGEVHAERFLQTFDLEVETHRHVSTHIDCNQLVHLDDDVACDDEEMEPAPEVTDLEDPMQAVIALNTMSHTMVFDDGGATTGGTAAASKAAAVITKGQRKPCIV
ncbi:hypothetical protein HPB50_017166 [Hyalomma asiaticum]|uniref:Uncharacterized protein n=1 Tax=Hyalomma asiaticum TaxID=266040 RepID=A0ACB7RZL4_HYAAI|nr:hypothetical protein HPB50_017166 [Hyalomma asiaticum]